MYRLNKGDYANVIKMYVQDWRVLRDHLPLGGSWNLLMKDIQIDFKRYCPRFSNGITELGQELLNQSIEVYMYAILGAQAKARQIIVGNRASAREVQQVFRNIVEDAVVQYSPSVWIELMNKAIKDTHVKLDMAVTPNTWLIPRSMVSLKSPISGYNNLLRQSTGSGMTFGYNDGLNYHVDEPKSKVVVDVVKKSEDNDTLYVIGAAVVGAMVSKFIL